MPGQVAPGPTDPATVAAADVEVMTAASTWLRAGHRVALATVLRTWGSAPRPPGALLAINAAGGLVGSVSGGCIEQGLASRYRSGALGGPFPARVEFGVDSATAGRLGLPCGGRLELLVEELAAPEPLDALLDRLRAGALVARRVCLTTGEVSLHPDDGSPELRVSDDAVVKVFGPAWHLLLVGDGQLARQLATMARLLDYRVTICDPREEFADPFPLTDVTYTRQMPDDAVRGLADEPRSAIVTLAHDPRQDDLALTAAIESSAFYVGALGSARSAAARRARLLTLGFAPAKIGRVRGPAGLDIGSRRPAEIALSILAEITAVRNGVDARAAAASAPVS